MTDLLISILHAKALFPLPMKLHSHVTETRTVGLSWGVGRHSTHYKDHLSGTAFPAGILTSCSGVGSTVS